MKNSPYLQLIKSSEPAYSPNEPQTCRLTFSFEMKGGYDDYR